MNLIDTHAHLYWDSFKEDFDEILGRAIETGLSTIINVGVDVEKSEEALKQAQKLSGNPKWQNLQFYSTIGIHPHEYFKYNNDTDVSIHEDVRKLRVIYQSSTSDVIGVGECGLDFLFESNLDSSSNPINQIKIFQKKLFQAQIDLARQLNLPLIVHCRDDRSKNPENAESWNETISMTKNHFGIYHCYSGLPSTTNLVLSSTNFLISFAANITYPKNEYLREAAKIIPLERIVLETDSPFLAPQGSRGQRNEPANVLEVAKTIAQIKGLTIEEIARKTSENVAKLFRLGYT